MEDTHKKKVLVVDDDDNLRTVMVDKLSISGFEATGAHDGEEGLKMALDEHPDVILLDVKMPKMDGWTMLGKLREDSWGKDARVIMLTVLENTDSVAEAMEKGSYEYLIKTRHGLDDIVSKVTEILKNKHHI